MKPLSLIPICCMATAILLLCNTPVRYEDRIDPLTEPHFLQLLTNGESQPQTAQSFLVTLLADVEDEDDWAAILLHSSSAAASDLQLKRSLFLSQEVYSIRQRLLNAPKTSPPPAGLLVARF